MTLMTTIPLPNRTSIGMSCDPPSDSPAVQVRVHDTPPHQDLLAQGGTVFVELDAATAPLGTTVTIHGGSRDVYVWEAGREAPWPRDAEGRCHHKLSCPSEIDLQVVALPGGNPPPAAPPAPGSGQAILKVKVRKKGDLPL